MSNKYRNHLCIVFAIEHYNPLGVIRTLGEYGVHPVFIGVKNKVRVASASKYISKCHQVDTVEEGYAVLMEEYGSLYQTEEMPFFSARMTVPSDILTSTMRSSRENLFSSMAAEKVV